LYIDSRNLNKNSHIGHQKFNLSFGALFCREI